MAPVIRRLLLVVIALAAVLPASARWRSDTPARELVPPAPGVPVFVSQTSPPVAQEVAVPEYPAALRSAGATGTVSVTFCVMKDGKVDHVSLVRSLSSEADDLVMRTVRAWRFTPAMRDGKPEHSRVHADFTFTDRGVLVNARYRGTDIALPLPEVRDRASSSPRDPVLVDREGTFTPAPSLSTAD